VLHLQREISSLQSAASFLHQLPFDKQRDASPELICILLRTLQKPHTPGKTLGSLGELGKKFRAHKI
jgi:hypothetical protein